MIVTLLCGCCRGAVNSIDDYAKDGGEELFTKMHRVLSSKSYRIVKDS